MKHFNQRDPHQALAILRWFGVQIVVADDDVGNRLAAINRWGDGDNDPTRTESLETAWQGFQRTRKLTPPPRLRQRSPQKQASEPCPPIPNSTPSCKFPRLKTRAFQMAFPTPPEWQAKQIADEQRTGKSADSKVASRMLSEIRGAWLEGNRTIIAHG